MCNYINVYLERERERGEREREILGQGHVCMYALLTVNISLQNSYNFK